MGMKIEDWLEYDEGTDILTICGVKYSRQIFEHLGIGRLGTLYRLVERHDGVVTISTCKADGSPLNG